MFPPMKAIQVTRLHKLNETAKLTRAPFEDAELSCDKTRYAFITHKKPYLYSCLKPLSNRPEAVFEQRKPVQAMEFTNCLKMGFIF